MEDIAASLGVSKASVFQHFGSKERLFLETYKQAITMLPRYLDAPAEVRNEGFFATVRHWVETREHLVKEHWIPYRVVLVGHYCTDLELRKEISAYLANTDPYGTVQFVRMGLDTGELRDDIEPEMIVSLLDWLVDRVLDALVTAELDPGLFRPRGGEGSPSSQRIDQFMRLLERAIGAVR
jgi:AcrR family transcriptional regulator